MPGLKQINFYFTLSCAIGVSLSIYAYIVELRKEADDDYVAVCDINEHISCTKAFASKYGKGFGIVEKFVGQNSILNQPNSLSGIFFYFLLAVLNRSEKKSWVRLQLGLCILSNFLSVYLACILIFILHDFCVVCVTTYVVNAVNLYLAYKKQKLLKGKFSSQSNGHDALNNYKNE